VLKAWELDPERTSYTDLEVAYFQNARRMRPTDARKLCNQAVMLHVVYGSFNPKELSRKMIHTYQDSNRRAENLFKVRRREERRLERNESKSIIPPSYMTNNLPLVT